MKKTTMTHQMEELRKRFNDLIDLNANRNVSWVGQMESLWEWFSVNLSTAKAEGREEYSTMIASEIKEIGDGMGMDTSEDHGEPENHYRLGFNKAVDMIQEDIARIVTSLTSTEEKLPKDWGKLIDPETGEKI